MLHRMVYTPARPVPASLLAHSRIEWRPPRGPTCRPPGRTQQGFPNRSYRSRRCTPPTWPSWRNHAKNRPTERGHLGSMWPSWRKHAKTRPTERGHLGRCGHLGGITPKTDLPSVATLGDVAILAPGLASQPSPPCPRVAISGERGRLGARPGQMIGLQCSPPGHLAPIRRHPCPRTPPRIGGPGGPITPPRIGGPGRADRHPANPLPTGSAAVARSPFPLGRGAGGVGPPSRQPTRKGAANRPPPYGTLA
jgi:hypothetical protein